MLKINISYCVLGTTCPSHSFSCANNECLPHSKICDGVSDCQDNSDETNICKGKIFEVQRLLTA